MTSVYILALHRELALESGEVPDKVELIPAGSLIKGRDGREFTLDKPESVVREFKRGKIPIPIDVEHSSELQAPHGLPAPAVAWINELEVKKNGSIWGTVDWLPEGASLVRTRQYRFLSPAFRADRTDNNKIMFLLSAGLTNNPNLHLAALNRQERALSHWVDPDAERHQQTSETNTMNAEILKALGLAEGASEADAIAAINTLKTTPSLNKFVPRADYDTALNRAATAEAEVKKTKDAAHDQKVETAVLAAKEAGKITVGTMDFYRATCATEKGLKEFEKFVTTAPVILNGEESSAGGEANSGDSETKVSDLTPQQKDMADDLGVSHEDYAKEITASAQA